MDEAGEGGQGMPDAVVLGGGVAGSSLAIRLAALGWETILLDRQIFPRHKACGEFLSPETRDIFKEIGVHDRLEALNPGWIECTRLVFRHGGVVEANLDRPAWGLSRWAMDDTLLQAAEDAGAQVRTGTAVTSIAAESPGFRIAARSKGASEMLHSRTAYAAWGARPRMELSGKVKPEATRGKRAYIGLKAHLSGVDLNRAVELYFTRGGYVGLAPIENGLVNVAGLLPLDQARRRGGSIYELLLAAAAENGKLGERLREGTLLPGSQVSSAPVYLSDRPICWSDIPHIGDACAMIPPLFGDGMSAALRTARICARYGDLFLRGEISMEAWKQSYSQAVNAEYASILKWGRVLHTAASMPILPRLWTTGTKIFPRLGGWMVQVTRLNGKMPFF